MQEIVINKLPYRFVTVCQPARFDTRHGSKFKHFTILKQRSRRKMQYPPKVFFLSWGIMTLVETIL